MPSWPFSAGALVGIVLSMMPRTQAFHPRFFSSIRAASGCCRGRYAQSLPCPSLLCHLLWPPRSRPEQREFRTAARPRTWSFPAHARTKPDGERWGADEAEFDWGEPSKEEIVLEARMAERDEVPEWARALTLGGKPVHVRPFQGRGLPPYLLEDAFDLTKANMQDMYLRSIWGWNEAQKRADLESPMARFFVATDEHGHLQGFIHYRFELIDNKFTHETSTAAYVLELQVIDSVRRLGLGTLLMKAVEEVATRKRMDSTMLCVFRYNEPAVGFYIDKMGYTVDASSAFNDNQQDVWELVRPSPSAKSKAQLQ